MCTRVRHLPVDHAGHQPTTHTRHPLCDRDGGPCCRTIFDFCSFHHEARDVAKGGCGCCGRMPVGPGFPRVQPDSIRVGASVVHRQLHWWVRGCILCGAGQPHVSLPCVANPTLPFTVCMSPLPTPCSSPTTPFQSFLLDHHWAAGVLPQLRLRHATASLIQAHTMLPCTYVLTWCAPCFASIACRHVTTADGSEAIWAPPGGCGPAAGQQCFCLPDGTSTAG
jgi:hypothetical protein